MSFHYKILTGQTWDRRGRQAEVGQPAGEPV
jgi:hypothetical protein